MTSDFSGIPSASASTETASPDREGVLFGLRVESRRQLAALDTRLSAAIRHAAAISTAEGLERSHAAATLALALHGDGDLPALATAPSAGHDTDTPAALAFPGAKRRGHLALVPDPQPPRRHTPCPAGCVVDHNDPHENGNYHYTDPTPAGPVSLRLDIGTDDRARLEIVTDHADGDPLDLGEVDELIAVLTAKRAEMAAEIARRTTLRPTGGAA